MPEPRLRVAICGGGIGGLTLAVALQRYPDVQVDVYEAAAQFTEIGAGVSMWDRTWRIFQELGLENDLDKLACVPLDGRTTVACDFRKSDEPDGGSRFLLFERPYGCIRFHRADLLDVLVRRVPKEAAHFGKKLTLYREQSNGVTLLFGVTADCDVLVGCDGIRSVVRKEMYEQAWRNGSSIPDIISYINPVWNGTITYRALIPGERLRKEDGSTHRMMTNLTIYCGKNKHIVSYAISAKRDIGNLLAYVSQPERAGETIESWITQGSKQDLVDAFANFEPEVRELLEAVENPTQWAIHELRPLPQWVTAKVALLGDAAHAMTPHLGAGAGQAIEDAYVLAVILGDRRTTRDKVAQALNTYEDIRMPIVTHVMQGSTMNGMRHQFNLGYEQGLEHLGQSIARQYDWLDENLPTQQVENALNQLHGI